MPESVPLHQIHSPHPCPNCGERFRRFLTGRVPRYTERLAIVCLECAGIFVLSFADMRPRVATPADIFVLAVAGQYATAEKIRRMVRRRNGRGASR